jgi:hypothetical protein
MRVNTFSRVLTVVAIFPLIFTFACGGGGGGSSSSGQTAGSALSLRISTDATLPRGLQQRPYSVTFVAENGQGALHWTLNNIDSLGLSLDTTPACCPEPRTSSAKLAFPLP